MTKNLTTVTGEEMLKMELEPESPEESYRRGHQDGWVEALNAIGELMFKKRYSRDRAHELCWNHWITELYDWVNGNCEERTVPPFLQIPPKKRKEI